MTSAAYITLIATNVGSLFAAFIYYLKCKTAAMEIRIAQKQFDTYTKTAAVNMTTAEQYIFACARAHIDTAEHEL